MPDKRRVDFRRVFIGVAMTLPMVGLACLLWKVATTETGWQTLARHWRHASVELIGERKLPLKEEKDPVRATYWLDETARIVGERPIDAQAAMGAAMLLFDAAPRRFPRLPSSFDRKNITQDELLLISHCADGVLAFAAKAVGMERENVEWHRIRAMLMLYVRADAKSLGEGDEGWQAILAECRRGDPDNALYDYVAACVYCETSSTAQEWVTSPYWLTIDEPQRFQVGVECFREGIARKGFHLPTAQAAALAHTIPLSRATLADAVGAFLWLEYFPTAVTMRLLNFQFGQATRLARDDDVTGAMKRIRDIDLYLNQAAADDRSLEYEFTVASERRKCAEAMQMFVADNGYVVTDSENATTDKLRRQTILKQVLNAEAREEFFHEQWKLNPGTYWSPVPAAFAHLADELPAVAVWLSIAAALSFGLAKRLGGVEELNVGRWFKWLALAMSLTATILFCGLAPMGAIPNEAQYWFFTAIVLFAPTAPPLVIGFLWLRKRRYRFGFTPMLGSLTYIAVLLGAATFASRRFDALDDLPFRLRLNVKSIRFEYAVTRYLHRLTEIWIEWNGFFWTAIAWLVLVAIAFAWRISRRRTSPQGEQPRLRQLAGTWLRIQARGLAWGAALMLYAYLAIATAVLQAHEEDFQQAIFPGRHPDHYRQQILVIIDRIESDDERMAEMNTRAASIMQWPIGHSYSE